MEVLLRPPMQASLEGRPPLRALSWTAPCEFCFQGGGAFGHKTTSKHPVLSCSFVSSDSDSFATDVAALLGFVGTFPNPSNSGDDPFAAAAAHEKALVDARVTSVCETLKKRGCS